MTYKEAQAKALTVPWIYQECQQENCWCACIRTGIMYQEEPEDEEQEFYVCGSGGIDKVFAAYIVETHNLRLIQENIVKANQQDKKDKDIYGYYAD